MFKPPPTVRVVGVAGLAWSEGRDFRLRPAPQGYSRYVRLLHPAVAVEAGGTREVSWADAARRQGRKLGDWPEWHDVVGRSWTSPSLDPEWGRAPQDGSMPPGVALPLAELLGDHTSAPEDCRFAFWTGYGWIREYVSDKPTVTVAGIECVLFEGPLAAMADFRSGRDEVVPNLWWPADRAWFCGATLDAYQTVIGCNDRLAEELSSDARFETRDITALAD